MNRRWYQKKRFFIPLGVILLFFVIGALTGDPETPNQTASTPTAQDRTDEQELTRAAAEAEARASAEAEAEAAAAAQAEEEASAAAEAEEAASAAAEARASAEAEEAAKAEAQEAAKLEAEEAERLDPGAYEEVSQRDWALVVKDPDAHAGERFVLYGHITQFDSATGTDAFLADTGAISHAEWYEYEHNTLVTAVEDPDILSDVVESDLVKMHVEVVSSFSYDTQIGGNTTVPLVSVNIIEVVGSSL